MSCHAHYRKRIFARLGLLAALSAAVAVLFAADLASGGSDMTIAEALTGLTAGPDAPGIASTIVWSIRLPMTLTALFVGTALAVAGLEIQNITGNALASPSTLGIASAASFGAAAAITAGFTLFGHLWAGTALAAFVFALIVSAAVWYMAGLRGMSPTTLILAGIVMNFFFMALQQFLQYRAGPEIAQLISGWTFGNLERSSWTSTAAAAAATALGVAFLLPRSWAMTAVTLGEERAKSLGVPVARLRVQVFFVSALLVACAVGFIGTVSFIGLVAPHCAKLLLGEDQRFVLPASVLTGAGLMLASSVAAKALSAGAMLPVGIVTSIVGVPCLIALLVRDRGARA